MQAPHGFREHASGLIVPEVHARKRIVLTKAEWKLIDKCFALLAFLGLRLQFTCDHPRCAGQPIEKITQGDGSVVLRCEHADRVFSKAF